MRVYEPLAAFPDDRAELWREYAESDRAISTRVGPAIQRKLLYEAMNPDWDILPRLPEEAYVLHTDDGVLVCPWQLRERCADAVRGIEDLVPANLVDAFAPRRLTLMADVVTDGPDARGDGEAGPFRHEESVLWHVPTRWFVCLEASERELDLTEGRRGLRYRVPMARARRRARRAYGIVQTSLGRRNPVAMGIRQLSEWLSVFHPRSVVEVDYGGLVRVLSDAELSDDDSPQLVHDGLTALARGEAAEAGRGYERLMRRWRMIRLRERSNLWATTLTFARKIGNVSVFPNCRLNRF